MYLFRKKVYITMTSNNNNNDKPKTDCRGWGAKRLSSGWIEGIAMRFS
jgi:hypothetical protein